MLTLDFSTTGAATRPGVALIQLHDELWRATQPTGEVLGYVEKFIASDGARFRAKRLIVRERRFVIIGEFWAFDEAVDCFIW